MDGNDGKTIVTAQRTENGVDLGIDKAGSRDSGLQVIQANHVYRATKPVEGILDTTDEGLQILPPDDLLIRVAGITQHCLEQVGATVPARFRFVSELLCQSPPACPDRVEFPPERRLAAKSKDLHRSFRAYHRPRCAAAATERGTNTG